MERVWKELGYRMTEMLGDAEMIWDGGKMVAV